MITENKAKRNQSWLTILLQVYELIVEIEWWSEYRSYLSIINRYYLVDTRINSLVNLQTIQNGRRQVTHVYGFKLLT